MNDSNHANKRVLIAVTNIEIGGGAEKVATTVGNEFLKRGIKTTLLTFYTTTREHTFNGKRISMHEATPASILGKLPRALGRIWKVKQVCKEEKIDLMISFLEESNYYVLLSKLFLFNKTPMIVSVRNDLRNYNWLYKLLIRLLYPLAYKVVAVTKGVEKDLRENYSLKNTTTIYNPVDLEMVKRKALEPLPYDYNWLRNRRPLCISIGRLTKQKGQWHMVRAFVEVKKRIPEATLVILGGGPYRGKLQKLILDSGLQDSVFLLGKHKNVYPFLTTADLFLFSSVWEGMPNTMLEALSVGLPVVAADCGGPREILAPQYAENGTPAYPYHGQNGMLTMPLDSEPIFLSPTTKPLSAAEKMFADAVIEKLTGLPSKSVEERLRSGDLATAPFKLAKIIAKWEELTKN